MRIVGPNSICLRVALSVLVVIAVIFGHHNVYSQSKADSLKAQLKQELPDTVRVDALFALYNLNSDDDSQALPYLQEGIGLAEKINDARRIREGHLRLALLYDYQGKIGEANRSLDIVERYLSRNANNGQKARYYFQRGILQYFEGTYEKAIENFWHALQLYEEKNQPAGVASILINIGNCYREMDQNDKALEYYQKGLALYREVKDHKGASMAIGNIGNIYRQRKAYDTALQFYTESLRYNEQTQALEDQRIDLVNIGNLYLDKQEYSTARDFFSRAYNIAKQTGSDKGMLLSLFNIGQVESKLGHYDRAINYVNEALKLAKVYNYLEDIKDCYESLADLYEQRGELRTATSYRKHFELYRDSLVNENHLNEVKELELKYETAKKDKQIELLANERKLQAEELKRQATLKISLIIGIALVVVVALLVIYSVMQRLQLTRQKSEIKEITFKHQLVQLEMKALRAQINPHFIFNCLTSINRMIVKGDSENASLYLRKFGKLVRLILEHSERQVTLIDELELVESYIQLEQLRLKRSISYEIRVDPAIKGEDFLLPPLVLQPFVENAIWHGLMNAQETKEGRIVVEVTQKNERLLCSIEDNGVGRNSRLKASDSDFIKTKSMGIKITKDRLNLFWKNGLSDERIRIIDLKDASHVSSGTRVEINFPIEQR